MLKQVTIPVLGLLASMALSHSSNAYPPAVGILGDSKDCLDCHRDNGPWKDDGTTIIDVVDKETGESLRQEDGSFLITARRGELKTVLTVLGSMRDEDRQPPYRNAWLYVDPNMIGASSLSSFAPGWNVNLPMACRIVGDRWNDSIEADFTALPMSIRPTDAAQDAEMVLQVMLTKGTSLKGNAKIGLIGNYFERKVFLRITE